MLRSRFHRPVFFVAISLVLLLATGCGAPAAPTQSPTNTPTEVTNPTTAPPADTSTSPPKEPTTPPPGPDCYQWDEAKDHVGETRCVCGPVVEATYGSDINGGPTWLNIGRGYPDTDRFTTIIWGRNRGNFPSSPEVMYQGKTICTTGEIELYQGVAQIEAKAAAYIDIQ